MSGDELGATSAAAVHGATSMSIRWVTPLPQGNRLNAGTCTSTECLLAGADGIILASDAGAHWRLVPSGATEDLNALTCAGTNCYAAGAYGGMTVSSDGGKTWRSVTVNRAYALVAVGCASRSTCFAFGFDWRLAESFGPGNHLKPVVATTTDSGGHWTVHKTTRLFSSAACPAAKLCLATSTSSDAVWISSDGGVTWKQGPVLADKVSASAIACPVSSICYVSAYGGMFKSANGGKTWSRLKLANGDISLGYLACASAATCLSIGSSGLERTDDGGKTWKATKPTGWRHITGVVCAASGKCFALGTGGEILIQSPAGTWAPYSTAFRMDNLGISCQSLSSCGVLTMDDFGPGCGSGSCGILSTADGGASWTQHRFGVTPSMGNWNAMACPSEQICFVTVGNLGYRSGPVIKTVDGGLTWTVLKTPASGMLVDVTGISCPTVSICFAAGEGCLATSPCQNSGDGFVMETADGGQSWRLSFHVKEKGVGLQPFDVLCVSVEVCYATGVPGWIAKTSDGGKTWVQQTNPLWNADPNRPASTTLRAIACTDAADCVIVGQACPHGAFTCSGDQMESAILTTHDGGKHWIDHSAQFPVQSYPSFFGSPILLGVGCNGRLCLAVGEGGTIVASQDGGNTWHRQTSSTDNWLTGVSCPAAKTCLISGDEGAILSASIP